MSYQVADEERRVEPVAVKNNSQLARQGNARRVQRSGGNNETTVRLTTLSWRWLASVALFGVGLALSWCWSTHCAASALSGFGRACFSPGCRLSRLTIEA